MITSIHVNSGYNEAVDFFNNEISSPSTGLHSQVVLDMLNTLPTNDFWFYVQEVYSDPSTYKGSFIVLPDLRLLYLEDGRCKYVNFNTYEVENLLRMKYNGIEYFYTDTIPLYNTDTLNAEAQSEISGIFEYGCDVWYHKLREGVDNTVTAEGRLQASVVKGARCGNYNIKFDLTPFGIIIMKGARNHLTKFQIRAGDITDKTLAVVWNFTYNNVGDIMAAPDSPESRECIKQLISEGVVFAEL